jgi:hypothetical protein
MQYHLQMVEPTSGGILDDDAPRRCDLCNEPISASGGYGSGSLADGLYCSLNCFALKDNRHIPSLCELASEQDSGDDYES